VPSWGIGGNTWLPLGYVADMAISEEEQRLQEQARTQILKAVIGVTSRSNVTGEALKAAAEAYSIAVSDARVIDGVPLQATQYADPSRGRR